MLRTVVPQIIKSVQSDKPCQCNNEANKKEYERTKEIIATITKQYEYKPPIRFETYDVYLAGKPFKGSN